MAGQNFRRFGLTPPARVRDQVFISYSHADSDWLERLQTMLAPLQRQGTLKVWADTDIRPGQLWKEEIKQALARAKVAVLLVSPNFLASDFIDKHELPPLLGAARQEDLTIIWIPLRPCLYEETVIGDYHAAYNPRTPLSTLPQAQQEIALTKIARTIKSTPLTALSESSPAEQGTAALSNKPVPAPTVEPEPPPQYIPPLRIEPGPPTTLARSTLPAIQSIYGWSAQQVQKRYCQLDRRGAHRASLWHEQSHESLRRLPLSCRDHQPRDLAVFSLYPQLPR